MTTRSVSAIAGQLDADRAMLNVARGGTAAREAREVAVNPTGVPSSVSAVMIATPAAGGGTTGGRPPDRASHRARHDRTAREPGESNADVSGDRNRAILMMKVTMQGPAKREARTERGRIVFEDVPAGTYRLRFDREGFISLEREVAARGGAPMDVKVTLTPAPPPPPPPEAKPAPPEPVAPPSESRR